MTDDDLLREAARRIREGHLRFVAIDPDMVDARKNFYAVLLIVFRSMADAGWSRFNALVLVGTMAWLTMNDIPPPPEPPQEGT